VDADFVAKQGDAGPLFTDVITDQNGDVVDLTGLELAFIMQDLTATVPMVLTGVVSSGAPTQGAIQYQPTPADTARAGSYMANWQVTTPETPFTADTVEGSDLLGNVSSYANVAIGVPISGDGIPAGTYVKATDGVSTVQLTNPATADGTGVTLTPGTQITYPIDGYLWVDIEPNIAGSANLTDSTESVLSAAELVRPSVASLASLCRARTVAFGSGGAELGKFTSATRPTYDEAQDLIDQAVTHVLSAIGFDVPDWTYSQVRQLVLLYAARLVELTFYAQTVNKDESPFEAYGALYDEALENLQGAIEDNVAGAPRQGVFSVAVMTRRQQRIRDLVEAGRLGTFRELPDDMRYPMGPKGLPWDIPGNSAEWDAFDWSYGFDSWMEVDV
jgi:hypothetical protein